MGGYVYCFYFTYAELLAQGLTTSACLFSDKKSTEPGFAPL